MIDRIANLHARMSEGGGWREWRDEIAALHAEATTQQEFVILMEAFSNLAAVGPMAFDETTWSRILPVAESEYRMFLNAEACEGGTTINPLLLKYITEREVAAGRMAQDDNFYELANAAGRVFGVSSNLTKPLPRPGNWLAGGLAIGGVVLWIVGVREPISPLWLIPLGMVVGWYPNHRVEQAAIEEARQGRLTRGYPDLTRE